MVCSSLFPGSQPTIWDTIFRLSFFLQSLFSFKVHSSSSLSKENFEGLEGPELMWKGISQDDIQWNLFQKHLLVWWVHFSFTSTFFFPFCNLICTASSALLPPKMCTEWVCIQEQRDKQSERRGRNWRSSSNSACSILQASFGLFFIREQCLLETLPGSFLIFQEMELLNKETRRKY